MEGAAHRRPPTARLPRHLCLWAPASPSAACPSTIPSTPPRGAQVHWIQRGVFERLLVTNVPLRTAKRSADVAGARSAAPLRIRRVPTPPCSAWGWGAAAHLPSTAAPGATSAASLTPPCPLMVSVFSLALLGLGRRRSARAGCATAVSTPPFERQIQCPCATSPGPTWLATVFPPGRSLPVRPRSSQPGRGADGGRIAPAQGFTLARKLRKGPRQRGQSMPQPGA